MHDPILDAEVKPAASGRDVKSERHVRQLIPAEQLPVYRRSAANADLKTTLRDNLGKTDGIHQTTYTNSVLDPRLGGVIVGDSFVPEMEDPRFALPASKVAAVAGAAQDASPDCSDLTIGSHARGHNYYHWMTQCLFNTFLLDRAGALDHTRIFSPPLGATQSRTVALLGIPLSKFAFTDADTPVRAKSLTFTNVLYGRSAAWKAPKELREMAMKMRSNAVPSKASASPAIYISRLDSKRRVMKNEVDLIKRLEEIGVEHVNMSGKTVDEQIAIVASAKVIIAPHGAALTNVLFGSAGAIVYELFPKAYVHPCYELLTRICGLHYTHDVFDETSSGRHKVVWTTDTEKVASTVSRLMAIVQ